MRAKIKGFSSPDIEDFHSFTPENLENFSFLFEFMVGPGNESSEEIFAIQVCTPRWLLSKRFINNEEPFGKILTKNDPSNKITVVTEHSGNVVTVLHGELK